MNFANPTTAVAPRTAARWLRVALATALILCACGTASGQDADAPADNTGGAATAPAAQPPAAGRSAPIIASGVNRGVVNLTTNRSTVLKTRVPYKNVSIAQPDVADVNLVGPQDILVTAKKPGSTQLVIWDDDDRSQVVEVVVAFDLQALQALMAAMFPDGRITVTSLNGTIALRGRVPSIRVAEQAAEVAAPYGQKVRNFLEVSGGQQVMLQIRFAEISRS